MIRKNANDKNGEGHIKTTTAGGETVSEGHDEGNGDMGTRGQRERRNGPDHEETTTAAPQRCECKFSSLLISFTCY